MSGILSERSQRVVIDVVSSDVARIVSGVPQGIVLGPLLFLLCTTELFDILENSLVGYKDESTLQSTIRSPADRSSVSCSVNHDLKVISDWCNTYGMKINLRKTKAMVVPHSRTILLMLPVLSELKNLGALFDQK